jgi:hypothetical protein
MAAGNDLPLVGAEGHVHEPGGNIEQPVGLWLMGFPDD